MSIFEAPELWYQVMTNFLLFYKFDNEMGKQNAEFNENVLSTFVVMVSSENYHSL